MRGPTRSQTVRGEVQTSAAPLARRYHHHRRHHYALAESRFPYPHNPLLPTPPPFTLFPPHLAQPAYSYLYLPPLNPIHLTLFPFLSHPIQPNPHDPSSSTTRPPHPLKTQPMVNSIYKKKKKNLNLRGYINPPATRNCKLARKHTNDTRRGLMPNYRTDTHILRRHLDLP